MLEPQEEPAKDSPTRLIEMLFEESCLLDIKNSIKNGDKFHGTQPPSCFVCLSFSFVTVLAARTFLNKLFFNVIIFLLFFFSQRWVGVGLLVGERECSPSLLKI